MKIDFGKSLVAGFFVGVASLGTALLAGLFKQPITQAYSAINVPLTSGINANVVEKSLSFVGGFTGVNVSNIPTLMIASVLLFIAGTILLWLLDLVWSGASDLKGFMKLGTILSLGTLAFYFLLGGLSLPSWWAFVGIWVFNLVTGLIALLIAGLFNQKID